MDDDTKGCLLTFLILGVILTAFVGFLIAIDVISCNHLEKQTGYKTSWVFPASCFVEFNGIWYPDSSLYQVLEQDFQYELDGNLELDLNLED
jgi:hypothetical protein